MRWRFFCSNERSVNIGQMNYKALGISAAAVILSFIGGFLFANALNRSEIDKLRTEVETARVAADTETSSGATLSSEEVRSKIAEADQHPGNLEFQKNLGLALYRYGETRNDVTLIAEAARLLERASNLSPQDFDIIVGLGNAWFDIGYINKDIDALTKARNFYETALAKKPDDADVRTDLGMTYFLEEPPNDAKAISEFKRSLSRDPKHEKALEFIIQSLTRQGNRVEAEKYLERLRDVDPSNASLSGLKANLDRQGAVDGK